MSSLKKKLLYLILILLAIGVIVFIMASVDLYQVWKNIKAVGYLGFSAYFLACILPLICISIGWWIILRSHGIKPSLPQAGKAQLMAYAISFLTPSMYVGGEPLKSYYIGKICATSKTKVFSTSIYAKFQELTSLLILIYLGTIVMLLNASTINIPWSIWGILLLVEVIFGYCFIATVRSIFRNTRFITRLFTWLSNKGLLKKLLDKIIPKVERTEILIHEAFKHDWKAGLLAFVFNFISVAIAFIKPLIFFYFLYGENRFSLVTLAIIFTLSQLLQSFQITPGCIGLFEGGQIGIFALLGIPSTDAAAYLVIIRFVDFLIIGTGVYLGLHYGLVQIARGKITPTVDTSKETYPSK